MEGRQKFRILKSAIFSDNDEMGRGVKSIKRSRRIEFLRYRYAILCTNPAALRFAAGRDMLQNCSTVAPKFNPSTALGGSIGRDNLRLGPCFSSEKIPSKTTEFVH